MAQTSAFYQTPSIRVRLTGVILVFAVIALVMLGRSTLIQVIGDPKLAQLAKRQFESKIHMKPRRGLIVDRANEPLAINLETSSLAGSPAKILKSPTSLLLLSRALGTPPQTLKKKLDPKKSFAWFERHLTEERIERFKKMGILHPSGEMPEGLWIVKEMKRVYPHGDLARTLLGTVNVDAEGLEGVELWKNNILRGKGAQVNAIRDALGRPAWMSGNSNENITTQDGQTLELSIDASLQFGVEESLAHSMIQTRAAHGLVIAMDSNTGEILALAHSAGMHKVSALTDGFEPGSTLKPLILAQAIQRGVVRSSDSLFGHHGRLKLQGRTITEAEAHEKFSYLTLKKMIEVSSNIIAAELALKLGSERLIQSLQDLGLGKKTGTTFPGEINGKLPSSTKPIPPLTLATLGFGQSLLVTPLQMVRAYAALANGGFLVEPTLLKRPEGALIPKRSIFKPQTVHEVTQAMLLVTEGEKGTGKKARLQGYRIAGKTGTAQTVDPKTKRYSTSRYISTFIGYPVGVKQPITVLTLLDHPKGNYYSSETAAPLFASVMNTIMSRFSIPPTEPIQESAESLAAQSVKMNLSSAESPNETLTGVDEVNLDHPVMPSLLGLTPQEAMTALRPFQPQLSVQGFGLIKKQSPESGSLIEPHLKVLLTLGE